VVPWNANGNKVTRKMWRRRVWRGKARSGNNKVHDPNLRLLPFPRHHPTGTSSTLLA